MYIYIVFHVSTVVNSGAINTGVLFELQFFEL